MLELFWEAAVETVDESATRQAAADVMVVDYPDESALRRLWQDAGLDYVQTEALDMTMAFAGFEDYWTPFLSGVKRRDLKACLRRKILGEGSDHPFTLPAQTWAVRGTVPGA